MSTEHDTLPEREPRETLRPPGLLRAIGNGSGGGKRDDSALLGWVLGRLDERHAATLEELERLRKSIDREAQLGAAQRSELKGMVGALGVEVASIKAAQVPAWQRNAALMCLAVLAVVSLLNHLGVSLG